MPMPQLHREYDMLRQEYETAVQKLNSTMNSIKTFWSPELKRERSMRKEEMNKLVLLQEQLRMTSQENQVRLKIEKSFKNFPRVFRRNKTTHYDKCKANCKHSTTYVERWAAVARWWTRVRAKRSMR
jgi:hypothetical protein